uniref:Uncharacterized protein n=1 Tax=Arundo donax TaxID=35708 RepID=A0A0A9DS18_ARUDO
MKNILTLLEVQSASVFTEEQYTNAWICYESTLLEVWLLKTSCGIGEKPGCVSCTSHAICLLLSPKQDITKCKISVQPR